MGRLTREPEIRHTEGEHSTTIARYALAVDRRYKREGEQTADFPQCVVFGKGAEFAEKYLHQGTKIAEKYLHQGTKIAVIGRIQTGSYVNRDGQKVYTTDVVVEDQEFAESKAANESRSSGGASQAGGQASSGGPAPTPSAPTPDPDGFMNIPDGIDEELPFN